MGNNDDKTNATYEITDARTQMNSNSGTALEVSVEKQTRGRARGGSHQFYSRKTLPLIRLTAPNYKHIFVLHQENMLI